MTDRELLEAAAKAAGIEYGVIHDTPRRKCVDGWTPWNPLSDDGDALRLAVRCCFHVCVFAASDVDGIKSTGFVEVWQELDSDPLVMEYVSGNDPYAATRRAIVRAAAEIGRTR